MDYEIGKSRAVINDPQDASDPGTTDISSFGSRNADKELEEAKVDVQRETNGEDPDALIRPDSHVSIKHAIADFTALRKEFSRASGKSAKKTRTQGDEEKSGYGDNQEEPFDLEEALRTGLADEQSAGIRPKHISVMWDDLTVKGVGGFSLFQQTFPDALTGFFFYSYYRPIKGLVMKLLGKSQNAAEVTLLDKFKGICKPGEMVLVLGKPGSGCTTFLKTISNQRYGYTGITGDVLYGSSTADQFKKHRGEALYNAEDDQHQATLTVEQTLGFALDCKTPKKLPQGLSRADYKRKVIDTLLKMFNIEHTRNTVVGGYFIRGISGGEKKRVSIAEMMISNACVLAWDNSTRGLDASTALDYVKSLRIQTDLYKTATFVSLYQASENIYKRFDKVLVIDGGKEVYFGPATEARAYFESLGFERRPRQTTPDYVTGCTDEFERGYAPGFSPDNAPHDKETLAEAFRASKYSQQLETEIAAYKANEDVLRERQADFETAVRDSKRSGASRSVYVVGFPQQVWALTKRQMILKLQDRLALFLSWFRSIVIALILGSLYYNLDNSSASAFSKGGILFICLLFNAFEAFAELSTVVLGRPIVNKHKAYAFHRPSALWIANMIVDQAFAASRILVFSLIVYFMANLYRSPGAFFTFVLMIISGNIGMTLLFRTVGCICPDFDVAVKFVVVIISLLITTSGYLIQYQSEKVWLRWIYWCNILGLAFTSMMQNEFERVEIACGPESLRPSGVGYNDVGHQVCTLPGSQPGTLDVSGTNYLASAFDYQAGTLWRNWGIVIVLIAFFLFCNVFLGEFVNFGMAGNSFKIFAKPNKERTKLNDELKQKIQDRREGKLNVEQELQIDSTSILTWQGLNYDVPIPGGELRLLKDVYGYVKPGELTALMGASGAGKTTLLDTLANRKNVGVITGDIFVDGLKPGREFQRSTSYAEQMDIHDPSQTVREALRFSADLRQPYETSREEKYRYVEEVIALLEMEDIADAIIGVPEFGLPVEARKRVTIGVELAAKPQLLLFLDEPTSGLDSQAAFNIVRFLQKLARAGQAILCTIHQPNAALFENFDRLLLLKKGGRCVYFGDIGKDAHVLRSYLASHGAVAGESDNVAEFMLEAIGAGSSRRIGDRDWADIWAESDELVKVKETINQLIASRAGAAKVEGKQQQFEKEYASPLSHQLRVVCKRASLSLYRSPQYLFTRLFNHVCIALFAGLTYLNLDDSRSSLQYKVFVIFQVTVLPALITSQIEISYHIQRAIFFREQLSKMYSSFTFTFALVLAEMPYSILCAVGFFLPLYYIPGFQHDSSRAGYQFLMVLVTELFSVTLGQAIAALTPSAFISAQFDPFLMITFSLFCGVTITPSQMPRFWSSWLYQLNPFTRLIGGMVVTALHELPVQCTDAELNTFSPPAGQTCSEYMTNFFDAMGPGYIVDNSSTTSCQYCAYNVGDQFYTGLGLDFANRWRDLGIFAAFIVSNLAILFVGTRFVNWNKR